MKSTSLNSVIQNPVCGLLSKPLKLTRKMTPKPRRKRGRRRRLRLRSMALMKATMSNSVFVLRTRVDLASQVMQLTCTKFVQRK